MKIPLIGLGTWELRGKECTEVVAQALELGYRHIDTAHVYENHAAIQKAIAHFDRKTLYLTTKLSIENQVDLKDIKGSVEKAIDLALHELKTDYIDLYLIHWPDRTYPLAEIYQVLEEAIVQKKIRQAGVSNFTIHHLEDLLKEGCKISANQVEFHPFLYQRDLLAFCRSHQIELISYRSLGKSKLLKEPIFKEIGDQYNKSPAQVLLRWVVQKKIPVIPKASSKKHLKENLEIFDFTLSESEMATLDSLNQNKRFAMAEEPEFNY